MADRSDWTKTTCCYCGTGCGVEVSRDGSGWLSVRGDADHPTNRGMLCSKGRYLHHVVMDRSDRILYPRLRRRKTDAHERVSWDCALEHAAAAFRRVIERYGAESVAFYVSGQLLTEEYYVANKLVKGFIGCNNIDTNSRLCMSSAATGYTTAFGGDAQPASYEDIEFADCILVAGANPAWCHPILFRRLEAHKAANPEVKIIVVDPRRTETCALADLHLQINPGTDVSLFNAIAAHLVDHRLIDESFVEASTDGFARLREHLAGVSLERAAAVCGIRVEDIRRTAQWIGRSSGFLSMWSMGLNQSTIGVDKNLSLLNLHLLTGQIAKPGAGPLSLSGQPNAMGGREVGGLATTLAAHRNLSNPQHRAEVARFWGVERIAEKPGLTATELFDALEKGDIRAVWIICTNPALSLSDLRRVERGLTAAEFVVVQDISERSEAVSFADLVLPAAGWLEKQGTMTSSERRITYLPALLAPPGEALPDAEILCRFAHKMGWGEAFSYRDESEIYDEYRRLTRGTEVDVFGVSHERLRRERSVQWPCPSADDPGTPRLFTTGRFWTQSGKAQFSTIPGSDPPEPRTPDFPLVLTTGRTRDQWHTRTKTRKVNRLNQHAPIPLLEIHPIDATAVGVRDQAMARVVSRQSDMTVKTSITDKVKPGVVFLPMHWGKRLNGPDGRVNRLTSRRTDPRSMQPEFKYTAVRVEAVTKPKEKILVVGAGAAARRFVEAYREINQSDEIHVFGREPHFFYNRILLPDYIAGERSWESLRTMDSARLRSLDVQYHGRNEIVGIDRERREIEDATGGRYSYDKLLLCTGSRAFVPPDVPSDAEGVFTLRTRTDADRIREYIPSGGRVLVIGGGLLGLEMAASLHAAGFDCTVIEMSPRLMHRQLDPLGSEILREELEERGVRVICNDAIERYDVVRTASPEGKPTRVRGGVTREGIQLDCDAMIVAVGTRPNTELAIDAGLAHGRGVVVNDHLQTSDSSIYAAGEIAEHAGQLYGITAAAEEQASVAAAHMSGDLWAEYRGSVPFNILKIHGSHVCSMGTVAGPEAGYEDVVFLDRRKRRYKRCLIYKDRVVGAVLIGDRSGFDELRSLIARGIELEDERLSLLQTGRGESKAPVGRIVCTCNNVGEGNLEQLVEQGCTHFDALCSESRAGTGCGSCRPEIRMFLDEFLRRESAPLRRPAA